MCLKHFSDVLYSTRVPEHYYLNEHLVITCLFKKSERLFQITEGNKLQIQLMS